MLGTRSSSSTTRLPPLSRRLSLLRSSFPISGQGVRPVHPVEFCPDNGIFSLPPTRRSRASHQYFFTFQQQQSVLSKFRSLQHSMRMRALYSSFSCSPDFFIWKDLRFNIKETAFRCTLNPASLAFSSARAIIHLSVWRNHWAGRWLSG